MKFYTVTISVNGKPYKVVRVRPGQPHWSAWLCDHSRVWRWYVRVRWRRQRAWWYRRLEANDRALWRADMLERTMDYRLWARGLTEAGWADVQQREQT